MNTRLAKLALATPSARPGAISEANFPELVPDYRSASPLRRLSQRLKSDEQLAADLQGGIADSVQENRCKCSRSI